jgi:hypothetical protein
MRKLLILYCSFLVFFSAGFLGPRLLIPNGVGADGEKRAFTLYLIRYSRSLLDHPLERLFVTKVRILSLKEEPRGINNLQYCFAGATRTTRNYVGEVQAYTLFGLPYTKLRVYCNGRAFKL